MHMHSLNWLAILVAAISTMVVGFLWYSPILFAKPWMREMGYDPNDKAKVQEMQKSAGPAYGGSFVASLVSAFTLALILQGLRGEDLHFGIMASFHIWLGFVATVHIHWRTVHEAEHEAFCHQYWLPAGLLPRHGSDPLRVEVTTMQVSRAERQACLLQQEFVSSEHRCP